MTNSYEVYVGNLSTTVSTEKLKNLFSQVDQILHVWINPSYEKVTYGFIKFANAVAAEEACKRFNDQKLNFFQIKVRFSKQTKLKLPKPHIRNNSILLELPKKTGCSKNHSVKKILVKNLRENKKIVKDFTEACLEAENIAFPQILEIVKTAPEPPDLTTLETTVTRYFKPTCEKNTLQVDFDLSKGKLLTTEQYDKFFNMQLTKPRSVAEPKQNKKTKPFELDYRSVSD